MDTTQLLRTSGTVLAVAGLLLSACTSGEKGHSASASTPTAKSLAALPPDVPAALKPYYEQKLSWHACYGTGFECATMKVPLDYAKPVAADDLELQVQRKKATDSARHLGSLLVNPGGPGGSAIDYLHYAVSLGIPAPVTAQYDMTAVDPRGVARSEPVTCLTDRQMDTFTATDITPDDIAEVRRLVKADTDFGKGCQQRTGKLLPHVSTVDSARDMDVLRALLGDEKLTYIGKSYGTFLGATYAGLFPGRVGRLVLDGAMDPSVTALEASRAQAGGFEVAFAAFVKDCVKRSDCPLGTKNAADAGTRLDRLFSSLDAKPLPAGESRRLDEALAMTGVISAMYSEELWPMLRAALTKAGDGDGSALLQLSDQYYDRAADGSYGNLMYANAAVNCLDLPPALSSPSDVRAALPSFRKASPRFGENLAWSSLICGYWPVEAKGKARRIEAKGAAPILVVGTTRDPATPYEWSVSLADQLASGVLLTYEGDGHTAYGRGSECIDTAVNRYLLEGRAPADGKKCG